MRIATPQAHPRAAQEAAVLRSARVPLSITTVSFGGEIPAQHAGAPTVGIGVLGFAIPGVLGVAIGRKLRK